MHGRARGALTIALIVIACITTMTSALGLWGQRTFLNTDRFTKTVDELAKDPAVVAAMTVELTNQVMGLVDLQSFFEDVAPEHGRALAIVLTRPMRTFVSNTIESFVSSDRFREMFVEIVRRAHAAALRLLKGERLLVFSPPGRVTMNLVPMISQVLQRILAVAPGLLPVHDEIPDVSATEPGAAAAAKLRSALHLPPDTTFGQMQLSDIDQLATARRVYEVYERSLLVSLVVLVLSVVGAIWISTRRRTTVIALAAATAGSLIFLRRATFLLRDLVGGMPKTAVRTDAVEAVLDQLLAPLFLATGILVGILLLIAVAGAITSDWRWAVSLRRNATPWIVEHRRALQLGGGASIVVLLAVFDLGGWGVLLASLAVIAFELGVTSINPPHGQITQAG